MSKDPENLHLPNYDAYAESVAVLTVPVSASLMHGMMCGYLCLGADSEGEAYLRALLHNKKDEASRAAVLTLFTVFSISQQQINSLDFEFSMLLPNDNEPLPLRAKAFSEWCQGFTQVLTLAGMNIDQFYEEEAQEALQHLIEFAELDYENLDVEDEDEHALMEVSEYARMAVLRLHNDFIMNTKKRGGTTGTTH